MSTETTRHGKAAIAIPRLSDERQQRDGANGKDRRAERDAAGRFKPGNRVSAGNGERRAARGLVVPLGKALYRSLVSQLGPGETPTLALMHAAATVNHSVKAADYSAAAHVAGLTTKDGKDLAERAARETELSIRASVAMLEAARLIRHASTTITKTKTRPGFEPAGDT